MSEFSIPIYQSFSCPDSAITGGAFYRADQFPNRYEGSYFFADYLRGFIRVLQPEKNNEVTAFASNIARPVYLKVGPDGSLYYLSLPSTHKIMRASDKTIGTLDRITGAVYAIRYVGNGNHSPKAVISPDITSSPQPPLEVRLSAQESSDPDGDALSYFWNFGDGSPMQEGSVISHTYAKEGFYYAQLVVEDPSGASSSESIAIQIGIPPTAAIVSPSENTRWKPNEEVNFSGEGNDAEDGNLRPSALPGISTFIIVSILIPFFLPSKE